MNKNNIMICIFVATLLSGCSSNSFYVQNIADSAANSAPCTTTPLSELLNPPVDMVRKGVCVRGILYVDRESVIVFPDQTTIPRNWDVAVSLPASIADRTELRTQSGKIVWILGDIRYDKRCWNTNGLNAGETLICAPASRPIALTTGKLVVVVH